MSSNASFSIPKIPQVPRSSVVMQASSTPLSDSGNAESLSWDELYKLVIDRGVDPNPDFVNGPTSSKSRLRLFGKKEEEVRVTLFRDHHAWCPYCQKVWLWLEENKVPYRIEKITMFCYGNKEPWY